MKQLIIISGRSGSGKTVALHSLEDLDFYCIDNLPIVFLPMLNQNIGKKHNKIAISLDSRNLQLDLMNLWQIIEELFEIYDKVDLIYLDANDDILLQRFSETRRKHPLTKFNFNFTLREAIAKEREILMPICNRSNFILDTSKLTQHELYILIRSRLSENSDPGKLYLLLQSFGFKYGLPVDADFVFDVRCLPNPYWDLNLRNLNGLDPQVIEFLSTSTVVQQMSIKLLEFISETLICFNNDHRNYVTVALGCTGGKHRSVYLVELLGKKLSNIKNLNLASVQVRHRELSRNF